MIFVLFCFSLCLLSENLAHDFLALFFSHDTIGDLLDVGESITVLGIDSVKVTTSNTQEESNEEEVDDGRLVADSESIRTADVVSTSEVDLEAVSDGSTTHGHLLFFVLDSHRRDQGTVILVLRSAINKKFNGGNDFDGTSDFEGSFGPEPSDLTDVGHDGDGFRHDDRFTGGSGDAEGRKVAGGEADLVLAGFGLGVEPIFEGDGGDLEVEVLRRQARRQRGGK